MKEFTKEMINDDDDEDDNENDSDFWTGELHQRQSLLRWASMLTMYL
jgi:hypothetical protein